MIPQLGAVPFTVKKHIETKIRYLLVVLLRKGSKNLSEVKERIFFRGLNVSEVYDLCLFASFFF